jgi:hypothetical protein
MPFVPGNRREPVVGTEQPLVRCYHGLGDTIQFARYLPALCAIARGVTVWTQPKLVPLIQTVCGRLTVLPLHDGAPGVDYDVDVEIMELAYAFRATVATIPVNVPYLRTPGAPIACSRACSNRSPPVRR